MITLARYNNSFHFEVMIVILSICFVGILRQHIILLTCCNEAILHNYILLTAENMGLNFLPAMHIHSVSHELTGRKSNPIFLVHS